MMIRQDHIASIVPFSKEFEQMYIDLRHWENRIYTDEEVAWLPDISEEHFYKKEWDIRKHSCKKLLHYLSNKKRPLKIAEVGCGNGWLSYQLSQINNSIVVGVDINVQELHQAERVFAAVPNLRFTYGSLESLKDETFDIIVFAASIQYFKSFAETIDVALNLLKTNGEIHIVDSHFYLEQEVDEASIRSRNYFQRCGFEKMHDFYFHHSLEELNSYRRRILYNPHSALNKLLRKKNPFHWICIKK